MVVVVAVAGLAVMAATSGRRDEAGAEGRSLVPQIARACDNSPRYFVLLAIWCLVVWARSRGRATVISRAPPLLLLLPLPIIAAQSA